MTEAYRDLLRRPAKTQPKTATPKNLGKDGIYHPRLVTLGGDHSVALPALRALHEIYGPISVLHFDSHLDTYVISDQKELIICFDLMSLIVGIHLRWQERGLQNSRITIMGPWSVSP